MGEGERGRFAIERLDIAEEGNELAAAEARPDRNTFPAKPGDETAHRTPAAAAGARGPGNRPGTSRKCGRRRAIVCRWGATLLVAAAEALVAVGPDRFDLASCPLIHFLHGCRVDLLLGFVPLQGDQRGLGEDLDPRDLPIELRLEVHRLKVPRRRGTGRGKGYEIARLSSPGH